VTKALRADQRLPSLVGPRTSGRCPGRHLDVASRRRGCAAPFQRGVMPVPRRAPPPRSARASAFASRRRLSRSSSTSASRPVRMTRAAAVGRRALSTERSPRSRQRLRQRVSDAGRALCQRPAVRSAAPAIVDRASSTRPSATARCANGRAGRPTRAPIASARTAPSVAPLPRSAGRTESRSLETVAELLDPSSRPAISAGSEQRVEEPLPEPTCALGVHGLVDHPEERSPPLGPRASGHARSSVVWRRSAGETGRSAYASGPGGGAPGGRRRRRRRARRRPAPPGGDRPEGAVRVRGIVPAARRCAHGRTYGPRPRRRGRSAAEEQAPCRGPTPLELCVRAACEGDRGARGRGAPIVGRGGP